MVPTKWTPPVPRPSASPQRAARDCQTSSCSPKRRSPQYLRLSARSTQPTQPVRLQNQTCTPSVPPQRRPACPTYLRQSKLGSLPAPLLPQSSVPAVSTHPSELPAPSGSNRSFHAQARLTRHRHSCHRALPTPDTAPHRQSLFSPDQSQPGSYFCITVSALSSFFETSVGVGSWVLSQPPPRASTNCTEAVIS